MRVALLFLRQDRAVMEMRNAYQNMIRLQPQYVLPFFGPLEVLYRNYRFEIEPDRGRK
jgi:hypothetical protein